MNDDDKIKRLPVRFKNRDEERCLVRPHEVGKHDKCWHRRFVVDDKKAEVECADCGEKLNPMWVLTWLCTQETQWHSARNRYQDEMKRLDERAATKCQHCGQMTRISRAKPKRSA